MYDDRKWSRAMYDDRKCKPYAFNTFVSPDRLSFRLSLAETFVVYTLALQLDSRYTNLVIEHILYVCSTHLCIS